MNQNSTTCARGIRPSRVAGLPMLDAITWTGFGAVVYRKTHRVTRNNLVYWWQDSFVYLQAKFLGRKKER